MSLANSRSFGVPKFISGQNDSPDSFQTEEVPPIPPNYSEEILQSYIKIAPDNIKQLFVSAEVRNTILTQIFNFDPQAVVIDIKDFLDSDFGTVLLNCENKDDYAHMLRLKIHSLVKSNYRVELNAIRLGNSWDGESWVGPLPVDPNKAAE